MSYQKRNKSRNRFAYVLLIILIPLVFLSFASQEFPQGQKKSNLVLNDPLNDPTGITYLQCVKMEKKTVDKYLGKRSGKRRVILELTSNNITSADPTFKVYSYLAKKHSHHGVDVVPDTLTSLENCLTFQAGREYIIGNNYVTVKKLKDFIESLISPNYTYLKFTPIVTSSNHIAFKFEAYLVDKYTGTLTLIKPKEQLYSGFDQTNPSPPADPKG